jgi:2-polyprenyl-3-methyl-5-hydroxy-6-metoxy-1,4-benzoquinol methylase
MTEHATEVARGERFDFGANWAQFLNVLNDDRILLAEQSLRNMLGVNDLKGKRFLDIGSGSGLFSLAARRLGATVHSFDYDPQSVACTAELKRRYCAEDSQWQVEQGSVLDTDYLHALGNDWDVVYSWGVLHHTGAQLQALTNVVPLVRVGGALFIAIYNDQGWISRYWTAVKRIYNSSILGQLLMILFHLPYLLGARFVVRALSGRLVVERGMTLLYDMLDWLGGYPFEVATPEEIFCFFRDKGFILNNLKTCGGRSGCNEFVFRRP